MADANGTGGRRWLLFAWSPSGYHLHELGGEPPVAGTQLDYGGHRLEVVKLGVSPLPGDPRSCAYTTGV